MAHRGRTEDALGHELLCGEERFGNLTAEAWRAQSKMFHKKYSELGVLCVFVVNLLSQ
jgi:hypothetical protein